MHKQQTCHEENPKDEILKVSQNIFLFLHDELYLFVRSPSLLSYGFTRSPWTGIRLVLASWWIERRDPRAALFACLTSRPDTTAQPVTFVPHSVTVRPPGNLSVGFRSVNTPTLKTHIGLRTLIAYAKRTASALRADSTAVVIRCFEAGIGGGDEGPPHTARR